MSFRETFIVIVIVIIFFSSSQSTHDVTLPVCLSMFGQMAKQTVAVAAVAVKTTTQICKRRVCVCGWV
jgi:hypothetical protein